MESIPTRPEGDGPEAIWFKWAHDLLATKMRLISVPGQVDWSYTNRGIIADIKLRGGSAPAPKAQGVQELIITQLGSTMAPANPNLLICASFAGGLQSSNSPAVYVAKALPMRQRTVEFFFDNGANVTQKYTYFGPTPAESSYGDNFRTATDGVNTELEAAEPRYYTEAQLKSQQGIPLDQAIIYAIDTGSDTGVADPNGNPVTMIEVLPNRDWVRIVSQ